MTAIRDAIRDDLPALALLMEANMQSLSAGRSWGGTLEQLDRDVFEMPRIRIAVAARPELVGVIVWEPAYDVHHCVRGGQICDLFVRHADRGIGIAARLLAFACRTIADDGGVFVRGTAVRDAAPLYKRVAWSWDCTEVILGGRAFRTFAALAGRDARTIVVGLPDPAWNQEA